MNEGWTTYIERLLQELIHQSPGQRGLSYVIGYKALVDALELFQSNGTPEYQRLVIAFRFGEDPDAAYSRVPYDKGSNFILLLGGSNGYYRVTLDTDKVVSERSLGGIDVMLPYIKDYVKTYIGHSITTTQWKDHLYSFFADQKDKIKALDGIDWDVSVSGITQKEHQYIHRAGMVVWGRRHVTSQAGVRLDACQCRV